MMKKITKLLACLSCVAALTLVACNKEETPNPFAGGDNHITSFVLKKGDVSYRAVIAPDKITMTVPENVSLDGFTAEYHLCENAKINPDPATITDWESDEQFVVTAYNGAKSTYVYTVERSGVAHTGAVVLNTQAEVDAFGAVGYTAIYGLLTIGRTSGADTITSLAPLASLRVVSGGIIVNTMYMGEDFAAFERLETVGELHVLSKKVKNVSFPNLTAVRLNMNFDQTSAVHTLDFPELTTIDRSLRIYYADSLTAMNFPKLEQVRENATIEGRNTGIPLQLVDFPELTAVGGTLALTYVGKEEGCTFTAAKLATAGGLDVATSDVLSGIRFPALTAVNGDLSISKLAALADVQFPALTTVSGNLSMSTLAALTDLQLPALHTVAGTLKLTLPTLTKLTGLKALRKVGSFDATDLQAIDTLDVRGIEEIGTLILGYNTLIRTKGLTLVGNETFPGKLSLLFTTATTAPASAPDFPLTVKGIKTVEGLEIAGTPNTGMAPFDMMDISWLERVTGLLKISGMQRIKGINLSNLQSAGDLKLLNLNFLENLNLPKLEEITGYASGAATVGGFEFSGTSKVAAIELPELKSVEGNISITGLPAGNPTSGTISFPELESLTGTLTITSTNNAKFTSLNGFSALESAAGITISGFTQLSDFSPLGKVVCSLPDFIAWKITNCGGTATDYTFEKMQELYCGQNP